ncbi:DUF1059 domain-containing protein [Methanohalophilus portucalensis]|uniref:DUF1059 domain-containing protein n=2 Tax=Methanohalophilus portucalensis TaxID=39664 RepID=A0A1X7P2N5_9EURY|nr:DUF1059 domain-containing protein [Methanohalophilus portucalensis]ATU08068.1 DUF1059 domain-containing protein [Methanohalophilus portucalensis]RNI10045.1 DUF1059 domain-containing protein [Methanohalophilus portucalensis FDF-1]SMH44550.1 Predicted small metal-binding protein [Methanohalophilus portucalensis FDF-1]
MKIVKCRDLGFKCNFMATGTKQEEVEKKMLDHIEQVHGEELDKMSEDEMKEIKYRISTLTGRGCGCGAL